MKYILLVLLLTSCTSASKQNVVFKDGPLTGVTTVVTPDGEFEIKGGSGTFSMTKTKSDIPITIKCPDGKTTQVNIVTKFDPLAAGVTILTKDAFQPTAFKIPDISLSPYCETSMAQSKNEATSGTHTKNIGKPTTDSNTKKVGGATTGSKANNIGNATSGTHAMGAVGDAIPGTHATGAVGDAVPGTNAKNVGDAISNSNTGEVGDTIPGSNAGKVGDAGPGSNAGKIGNAGPGTNSGKVGDAGPGSNASRP